MTMRKRTYKRQPLSSGRTQMRTACGSPPRTCLSSVVNSAALKSVRWCGTATHLGSPRMILRECTVAGRQNYQTDLCKSPNFPTASSSHSPAQGHPEPQPQATPRPSSMTSWTSCQTKSMQGEERKKRLKIPTVITKAYNT